MYVTLTRGHVFAVRSVCGLPRKRETRLVSNRVCVVTPPSQHRRRVVNSLCQGVTSCVSVGEKTYGMCLTPFTMFLGGGGIGCMRPSVSVVYSGGGLSSGKYGKTPS